ncbi:O-antigen ligase [Riemerella anatipestifer]|nr:O-antigen ligase [Riemerella anatipestifer]
MIASVCIFLIIIACSVFIIIKSYYNQNIKLFDYILLWYTFIYAVVPLALIYDSRNIYHLYRRLAYDSDYLYEAVIFLVGYFFLIAGYYYFYKGRGVLIKVSTFTDEGLFKTARTLLIIGFFSYLVYVYLYGGISYVMNNVNEIRYGADDNKNYFGAFFRIFSVFIMYSFILQLYLYFKGKYTKQLKKKLMFLLTLFILLVISFLGGGRAAFISLFIYIFLAYYFLKTRKIKWIYLFLLVFSSLFIVVFGKTFLFVMFSDSVNITFDDVKTNQEKIGFLTLFFQEFNHQTYSVTNFIQSDFDYRYLSDYYIWMLKPLKLFYPQSTDFDAISYYNTYMIMGNWKSVIPPGFIGLGFLNGGLLLVILQSFIAGIILKVIDKSFSRSDFTNSGLLFFIYLFLFNHLWYALQNGDMSLIIQGSIPFYLLLIYLLLFRKVKFYK